MTAHDAEARTVARDEGAPGAFEAGSDADPSPTPGTPSASEPPGAPMEGAPLIRSSSTDHPLHEAVVEACRTVHDPEIPVNIYDLGLVYTIEITGDGDVRILMTLTAPGCPVAGEMPGWVAEAVEPLPGVRTVDVQLTWDPPWGMEMMSDEARLELGFM